MSIDNPIESRLLSYIADNRLHAGLLLPKPPELTGLLGCTEGELQEALQDMVSRGLLTQHGAGYSPTNAEEHDAKDVFSLSKTALKLGHTISTKVIEKQIRLPLDNDEEVIWSNMERRAQASLGLQPDEPFIVIVRLRRLEDTPDDAPQYAISRMYLNPANFPADFLDTHDFAHESLMHIYGQCGYEVTRRDTLLQARAPNLFERIDLKVNGYDISPLHPILHAEQELYAKAQSREEFHLEFLQATYVNWTYTIKNRPL